LKYELMDSFYDLIFKELQKHFRWLLNLT